MIHVHSFLLPNNIPLDGYATFCLSIHQLMGIWIVSIFQLLCIMELQISVYNFLSRHMFSILWVIYLEVKLLAYKVTLCLFF